MNTFLQRTILFGGFALLAVAGLAQTPVVPTVPPPPTVQNPVSTPPAVMNPNAATSTTSAAAPALLPTTTTINAATVAAHAGSPPDVPTPTAPNGAAAPLPVPAASRFSLLDTDGDGRLSAAEFSASMNLRVAEPGVNTPGVVARPAKRHWWSRKAAPESPPADVSFNANLGNFAQFDTDHDGYVSQAEFNAGLAAAKR